MKASTNEPLQWDEFMKVEMRIGTIMSAEVFTAAKKPAYKMVIDFGEHGTKKTSAQITKLYSPAQLVGRQVVAVVNFLPKQIATMMSECLVLGGVGDDHAVTLIGPESTVKNGTRIG